MVLFFFVFYFLKTGGGTVEEIETGTKEIEEKEQSKEGKQRLRVQRQLGQQ